MTDDEVLAKVCARAVAEARGPLWPVATSAHVERAELRLGFALPTFYRRMVTEVANGGFGLWGGLIGIPPDGYVDRDLGESNVDLQSRAAEDEFDRLPYGLLFLCNWWCAKYSFLDPRCSSSTRRSRCEAVVASSRRARSTSRRAEARTSRRSTAA